MPILQLGFFNVKSVNHERNLTWQFYSPIFENYCPRVDERRSDSYIIGSIFPSWFL